MSEDKIIINKQTTIVQFYEQLGTIVDVSSGEKFLNMPLWLQEDPENPDKYILLSLDELPDHIKKTIIAFNEKD